MNINYFYENTLKSYESVNMTFSVCVIIALIQAHMRRGPG